MEAGFELFLWIHNGDRSKSPNPLEWAPQPTQPILKSWTQRIFFWGEILFKKWPNECQVRLRCERIPPNHMGVDPKIWENPPNHPIFNRIFHEINHPFWGIYHYFWKHPYQVFLWTCSLSNKNGHLIQSTGPLKRCPCGPAFLQALLPSCPTLQIRASSQCPTSPHWVARADRATMCFLC